MKDRILESYLRGFTSEFDFETLEESLAFEYFVNYCESLSSPGSIGSGKYINGWKW